MTQDGVDVNIILEYDQGSTFIEENVISESLDESSDIALLAEAARRTSENGECHSQPVNNETSSRKRTLADMNASNASDASQNKKRIKVLYPKRPSVKKKQVLKAQTQPKKKITKKKVLQRFHQDEVEDDEYSNVCGYTVSIKSLLQNEEIRQQLAPFIQREVVFADCSDSDDEEREVPDAILKSRQTKNQSSSKQYPNHEQESNSAQENEHIQSQEPRFVEVIIPKKPHPDIIEVEENIMIGDNVNVTKGVAIAEKSTVNNLPIIEEIASIRDQESTFVKEVELPCLPDVSVSVVREDVIKNVPFRKDNKVLKNKPAFKIVPVLDLVESSDDEVVIDSSSNVRHNETVSKTIAKSKEQTKDKIIKKQREFNHINKNIVKDISSTVFENETIECIDSETDSHRDRPLLESDDWYYLNIANNSEAERVDLEESVTENDFISDLPTNNISVASNLPESEQNKDIQKVLTIKKRRKRRGKVTMPKKRSRIVKKSDSKTETNVQNIKNERKSNEKSLDTQVPNTSENENRSDKDYMERLTTDTPIDTEKNILSAKKNMKVEVPILSDSHVAESEYPEINSDSNTDEAYSNSCETEMQSNIKQEKVTDSPNNSMSEIPNLVYDNMRDLRQFLVVKRRVIIHNSGRRKKFRRRRAKFGNSSKRSERQISTESDGLKKPQRKNRLSAQTNADRSNLRESQRIKQLSEQRTELNKDLYESPNNRQSSQSKGKKKKSAVNKNKNGDLENNKFSAKRKAYVIGTCSKCGRPYQMYVHLSRHEAICQGKPYRSKWIHNPKYSVIEKVFYKCAMCNYKTIFKEAFKNHISKHIIGSATQVKKNERLIRKKYKDSRKELNTRRRIITKTNESCPPEYLQAFCLSCEEVTMAVEQETECKRCRSAFRYWCSVCRADFPTYTALRLHVLCGLKEKFRWCRCTKCNKCDFQLPCALKKHMALCGTEVKCDGFPYVRLVRYEMLMKVVEAPPYTLQSYCLECNVMKIAFESKVECDKCGFLLKYKCDICKKELVTYSDLRAHVKNDHGIYPHQCLTCGQIFGHKTLLKQHATSCTTKSRSCIICDYQDGCKDVYNDIISHVETRHLNKVTSSVQSLYYNHKQIMKSIEQFSLIENQLQVTNNKPPQTNKRSYTRRKISLDSDKCLTNPNGSLECIGYTIVQDVPNDSGHVNKFVNDEIKNDNIITEVLSKNEIHLMQPQVKKDNLTTSEKLPRNQKLLHLMRWYCLYCKKTNNEPLKEHELHLKKRHCKECQSKLYFQCFRCNIFFNTYPMLTSHLRRNCGPPIRYRCPKCAFSSFHSKFTVKLHMKRYHSVLKHEHTADCKRCEGIHVRLPAKEMEMWLGTVDDSERDADMLVCPVDLIKVKCTCNKLNLLPKSKFECDNCGKRPTYYCALCKTEFVGRGASLRARYHVLNKHRVHSQRTQAGREQLELERQVCVQEKKGVKRRKMKRKYQCADCGNEFCRLKTYTNHVEIMCRKRANWTL